MTIERTVNQKLLLASDLAANGSGPWIDLGDDVPIAGLVAGILVAASGGGVDLKVRLEHTAAPTVAGAEAIFREFNDGAALAAAGWVPISSTSPPQRYVRLTVTNYSKGNIIAGVSTSIRTVLVLKTDVVFEQ